MEFAKSVVNPIKQVAPRSRLRGMVEDYNEISTDILVLEGETHLGRKPVCSDSFVQINYPDKLILQGGLRFITVAERELFASTVLHDMRPNGPVRRLALKIRERMENIVEGRQWMGSHMRRGDCEFPFPFHHELLLNRIATVIAYGWAMEQDLESHFGRIKSRLSSGRAVLENIYANGGFQLYDVPDVKPEKAVFDRLPPKEGDRQVIHLSAVLWALLTPRSLASISQLMSARLRA
jgi:hypothetical protein